MITQEEERAKERIDRLGVEFQNKTLFFFNEYLIW